MVYKMQQVKSQYGPQGEATVNLSEDKKKVRVIFKPVEDEEPSKPIVLDRENCPDYVRKGKFYVRMSADKKKMYSMTPLNGLFNSDGSHVTLRHPKDEKPAPKMDNFQNLCFQVDIEITSGDCKGMSACYPYSGLRYNFIPVEYEGKQVVGVKGDKAPTKMLMNFKDVLGVDEKGPIAWSDNILPVLQKRITTLNRPFQFIVKSEEHTTKAGKVMLVVGIDGLIPMDNATMDDDDEDMDSEPEPTPAKKSAKKSKVDDDELPWGEPEDVEDDDDLEEEDEDTNFDDVSF
jgi:hypothetical protein